MAIEDTLSADRTLADIKVQEAESAPPLPTDGQGEVDRLLKLARDKMSDADTRRSNGDFGLAAGFYGHAWQFAVEAMNLQMQPVP